MVTRILSLDFISVTEPVALVYHAVIIQWWSPQLWEWSLFTKFYLDTPTSCYISTTTCLSFVQSEREAHYTNCDAGIAFLCRQRQER